MSRRKRWGWPLTFFIGGGFLAVMCATVGLALWVVIESQSNAIVTTGAGWIQALLSSDDSNASSTVSAWMVFAFTASLSGAMLGVFTCIFGGCWTALTTFRVGRENEVHKRALSAGKTAGQRGIESGLDAGQRGLSAGVDLGHKGLSAGQRGIRRWSARRRGGTAADLLPGDAGVAPEQLAAPADAGSEN